jgi:hypothetical protein
MRKTLLTFFLLSLFASLCVAQTAAPDGIPFKFEKGFMIVDAKIKGNTPVQFVISTGSEYSVIDNDQMGKHKLQSSYAADDVVTGRPSDTTYSFVPVSSVSLAGGKSRDLQMRMGSMKRISEATGAEVFGALGADFFAGQIVQFDFKNNVIRFLDKAPAKDASGGDAPIVLRMGEKASNPVRKTYVVPLVDGVKVNGKETKLLFDTGRSMAIALSAASATKAGLTAPEENAPPREDKIALDLAAQQIPDVPVAIVAKGPAGERSLNSYPAIAGSSFLREFLVTFDFKNKVVVLQRQ